MKKEIIEKISQTKLENGRKHIIEGFTNNTIPEQSKITLKIPTHRTKQWLSFDEFKILISEGKSLKELNKTYSKHLMAFYSYLSQGKITLTKEKFEECYLAGVSLNEISETNNVPREYITYLREYYGIKRKGANYQKRLKNEKLIKPLTQEAIDVIIGSMLGDGYLTRGGEYREKHSEKQVEYLEWKSTFFKDIIKQNSFYGYSSIDKRSGRTIYTFGFRTKIHSQIIALEELFYKYIDNKRTKVLPENISDMINEKVLMIWFLDDGHTDWNRRVKNKHPNWNNKHQCKISSESFTLEENKVLQKILKEKFGLNANITFKKRGNIRPYLRLTMNSSIKLLKIIDPIVPTNDMKYKTDEKAFLSRKLEDKENVLNDFISRHN